jgi:hypothetical protein
MRPSLTRLWRRAGEMADEAAAGRAVPAGTDPAEANVRAGRPSARERGAMRRRARQLRRRREAMLLELGALLFEMHRRDRHEPELLDRKLAEIRALDDEERALAAALEQERTTAELVRAGVAGPCPSCGLLAGTSARYCERCGTELRKGGGRKRAKAATREAADAGRRKPPASRNGRDDPAATQELPRAEGAASDAQAPTRSS